MQTRLIGMAGFLAALCLGAGSRADAQTVNRTCRVDAAGDACIFDLTATADGSLDVCTRAARSQDRWRDFVAQRHVGGAVSGIGSGSTSACTGVVSRSVVRGSRYVVVVPLESVVTNSYPTTATVQFTGPVSVTGPRRRSGAPEELQSCRQIGESGTAAVVDDQNMQCGDLVRCRIAPLGDADVFRFSVPANAAVSINMTRLPTTDPSENFVPCWRIFDPNGNPVTGFVCNNVGSTTLTPMGRYTIEVLAGSNAGIGDYSLSLQGVAGRAYACGTPMVYGDQRRGRIDLQGDSDTFNFNGTMSQTVSINIVALSTISGSFTPCWRLFDPNGNPVTGFVCANVGTTHLPMTGKYTIEVLAGSNAGTGDYRLTLNRVGGAP